MKVLVIGGGGYLGTTLVSEITKNKENEVVVYDIFHVSRETVFKDFKRVSVIRDDVENIQNHTEIFKELDRIYYLACPRPEFLETNEDMLTNIKNLEKTLTMVGSETEFIFTSSCSVYGCTEGVVDETSPPKITSLYSKIKYKSERILLNKENPNIKILRLPTLCGISFIERNDLLVNNLIEQIKKDLDIDIYNCDTIRPYLNVGDCGKILYELKYNTFDKPIINIGENSLNITKKKLVEEILGTIDYCYNGKLNYFHFNEDRNYQVNFDLLKKRHCFNYTPLSKTIYDLYVKNKIIFALEEWDSIVDYYRPNGSSKTWYLEEEGKLDFPKMWGEWNIFDVETGKLNNGYWRDIISLNLTDEYVEKSELGKQKKDPYFYFINVQDCSFFQRNKKIGFSCISDKYIKDIKRGACMIVIHLTHEGYSGSYIDKDVNTDLNIIDLWINDAGIPHKNVAYISGNLRINELKKRYGFKYHTIGLSMLDDWLEPHMHLTTEPIKFKPHNEKYLYLTYNRNPRSERVLLMRTLYKKNLLDKGLVSLGEYDYNDGCELSKKTPITIDRELETNWATDLSVEDHEKTFLSLVSETLVHNDTIFLSEKIWKPIVLGHPFIVFGNKGTLKYLKKLGYKTFDKWFDESYDDKDDLVDKINIISNEIENYNKKSIDELMTIRDEMKSTCIHNQMVFKKMARKKRSLGEKYYDNKPIISNLVKLREDMKTRIKYNKNMRLI